MSMYLSYLLTDLSLAKIGYTIGKKDHATVLHAKKTMENLIQTSKYINGLYCKCIDEMLSGLNDVMTDCCPICKGFNIAVKAWIEPETKNIIEIFPRDNPMNGFCFDCKSHIKVLKHVIFVPHDESNTLAAISD